MTARLAVSSLLVVLIGAGCLPAFWGVAYAGTTERVSVSSTPEQGDLWSWFPSISADGRFVVFAPASSSLRVAALKLTSFAMSPSSAEECWDGANAGSSDDPLEGARP